jgi:hypothetical protein
MLKYSAPSYFSGRGALTCSLMKIPTVKRQGEHLVAERRPRCPFCRAWRNRDASPQMVARRDTATYVTNIT